MAKWNKNSPIEDPDDDGRTVADMSDLAPHRNWLGGWSDSTGGKPVARKDFSAPEPKPENRPWEQPETLDREQRFWAIMGALKAALLLGLVYIVGLSLVVWLLFSIWS